MSDQRSSKMLLDHLLVCQFLLLVLDVGLVLDVLSGCCELPLDLKLRCRSFALSRGLLLDRMSR